MWLNLSNLGWKSIKIKVKTTLFSLVMIWHWKNNVMWYLLQPLKFVLNPTFNNLYSSSFQQIQFLALFSRDKIPLNVTQSYFFPKKNCRILFSWSISKNLSMWKFVNNFELIWIHSGWIENSLIRNLPFVVHLPFVVQSPVGTYKWTKWNFWPWTLPPSPPCIDTFI